MKNFNAWKWLFSSSKGNLFNQIKQVESLDGIRSKGEDKNDQNQNPEESAPGRKRFVFIGYVRMFQSQKIDKQRPDEPADPKKYPHDNKNP